MELENLYDLQAEEMLLTALLVKQDLIKDVYSKVKTQYFYSKKHQYIFQAIENLFINDEEIDVVTVSNELKRMNKLKTVGGRTFMNDLALNCLTSVLYPNWINIIKEKWTTRELQKIGQSLLDNCYQSKKTTEILNNLQCAIYNLSNEQEDKKEGKLLIDILANRYDQIDEAYTEYKETGKLKIKNVIPTGLKQFDKYLRGGFAPGELTYIAALSRVGKTATVVALQRSISRNLENIQKNIAIADFQLETGEEELADRHFANSSGIKKGYFTYVNNLNDEHWRVLVNSLDSISNQVPIKVFTNPDFNMLEIETKAAQYFNSVNKKGIIFIDNLQIVEDIRKGKTEIEVSTNITRDCKKLAQRLNVPVILLAQLVKAAEGSGEPSLKWVRGSQQVVANADNIILLHRDTEKEDSQTEMTVFFEKVRKGQTGKIKMNVDLGTNKFVEIEKQ